MNLTISGHHLEVSPALREYVVTKLDRITRHFDQVVDINVLLTVEKQKEKEKRQRAEVNLHVKGRDIFIEQAPPMHFFFDRTTRTKNSPGWKSVWRAGCSWRMTVLIPTPRRCAGSPMPDSCSNCGDWTAPVHSRISPEAVARRGSRPTI